MAKYLCHVENEKTGFITDVEVIEAENEAEAEAKYYEMNPSTGFDGDICIVTEA